MNNQIWSWVLTTIGLAGFFLAGKKIWWCWYVNIFNQILWLTYSIVTQQWGFLVGTVAYTIVFTKNAIEWTKNRDENGSLMNIIAYWRPYRWYAQRKARKYHRAWQKNSQPIGTIESIRETEDGIIANMSILVEETRKKLQEDLFQGWKAQTILRNPNLDLLQFKKQLSEDLEKTDGEDPLKAELFRKTLEAMRLYREAPKKLTEMDASNAVEDLKRQFLEKAKDAKVVILPVCDHEWDLYTVSQPEVGTWQFFRCVKCHAEKGVD